jgi:hypothetical protein
MNWNEYRRKRSHNYDTEEMTFTMNVTNIHHTTVWQHRIIPVITITCDQCTLRSSSLFNFRHILLLLLSSPTEYLKREMRFKCCSICFGQNKLAPVWLSERDTPYTAPLKAIPPLLVISGLFWVWTTGAQGGVQFLTGGLVFAFRLVFFGPKTRIDLTFLLPLRGQFANKQVTSMYYLGKWKISGLSTTR